MANYAQTVNVTGCIKMSKVEAAFATTVLVLKLYRHHFGVLPVEVACESPLEAMTAFTADDRVLTVSVVNPTMKAVTLTLEGVALTGTVRRIAGDDPMAYNEPGADPQVVIEEEPVSGIMDTLSVAPCSVTLFALDIR